MSDLKNEFINILVLGSSNTNISYFIKLFSAYLKYETYDDVMLRQSNLKTKVDNVKETTSSNIRIGNHKFHFIDTPGFQKSIKNYKEIIDVLLHFKSGSRLNAVILLIEPDKKQNENYFEPYTTHLFSCLRRYANNILYVVSYNDCCMYNQTYKNLQQAMDSIKISAIVSQKSNVFHLHEETFYQLNQNNWDESVHFCKEIFEYITKSGLKSFYVQCVKPSIELFLNLIDGLTIILCQVYYLSEFYKLYKRLYCVNDFQKNVTVCYRKDCIGRAENINASTQASFTICHASCNCTQSLLDVKACSIFQKNKNKCSVCNCAPSYHQRYFYKFVAVSPIIDISNEKFIIKSTLLQLFLFIMRYHSISISKFLTKAFSWSNDEKRGILEDIIADLESEINMLDKTHVAREKLLDCICKLHEIKIMTTILPAYIRENFPDGLRLEVFSRPQGRSQSESKSYKSEYYDIKKEFDELKELFEQMLNPTTSNDVLEQHNLDVQRTNVQSEIKNPGSYKTGYYNVKRELDELKVQFEEMLSSTSSNLSKQHTLKKPNCKKLNFSDINEYVSCSSSGEELCNSANYEEATGENNQ